MQGSCLFPLATLLVCSVSEVALFAEDFRKAHGISVWVTNEPLMPIVDLTGCHKHFTHNENAITALVLLVPVLVLAAPRPAELEVLGQ